MADIVPVRPLDEAAALEWLRSQPGGRTHLAGGRAWSPLGMAPTARRATAEGVGKSRPRHTQGRCNAPEPEQPDLFGGLQRRYPSSRQGEYVLLAQMSDADIASNVARLRKEGASKSKHADALEQFGRDKKKATAA